MPLHDSIEGWVESVALTYYASLYAQRTRKLVGAQVDALDLTGFEPVPEVHGLADTWWHDDSTLIAAHSGLAEYHAEPEYRIACVYEDVLDGILSPRASRW